MHRHLVAYGCLARKGPEARNPRSSANLLID
ncbi:hypothetical protein HNP84_003916 [Thermocatellispora tengchongensis]|uniref:Uncharacterized protein n=1 Tax=Thermocatellispora tengchongensis TaxID=1073253 RepID=A0A840P9U0_9ACTN|nr:hypothetical protein [Thermocatellispora tengchongensis]